MTMRLAASLFLLFALLGSALGQPRPAVEDKPVTEWVKLMKDPVAEVRRKTIQQIYTWGSTGWKDNFDELIPVFVAGLKDTDEVVRRYSQWSLQVFGPRSQKTLPALLEKLKEKEIDQRIIAAQTLAMFGRSDPRAIPPLAELLDEKNPVKLRIAVAQGLGSIGLLGRGGVPALKKALKDKDLRLSLCSAEALLLIQPDAPEPVREALALAKGAIKDSDEEVRQWAATVLARCAQQRVVRESADLTSILLEAIKDQKDLRLRLVTAEAQLHVQPDGPQLAQEGMALAKAAVKNSNHEARLWAVKVLARCAQQPSVRESADLVSLFSQYMKDNDTYVRSQVVATIASLGPSGVKFVPVLVEGIKDRDGYVQQEAGRALGNLGPMVKESLPAFLEAMKGKTNAKSTFYNALAKAGRDDPKVLAFIVQAISKDPDQYGRSVAGAALTSMRDEASLARPALYELLKENKPEARIAALQILSSIGPGDDPPMPVLLKLFNDENSQVRTYVGQIVQRLGPSLLDSLLKALGDKDPEVRSGAAGALGRFGATSKEDVVPALTEALKDKELQVRLAAAGSLVTMDRESQEIFRQALKVVTEGLNERDANVRRKSARLLSASIEAQRANLDRDGAMPSILQALRDEDHKVGQEVVLTAIRYVGVDGEQVAPILAEWLKDKDPGVRMTAAWALSGFGSKGKAAIPALKGALKSGDEQLRARVIQTLGLIANDDPEMVTILTEALKVSNDPMVRFFAAQAIPRFGNKAKAAIPALLANFQDDKFFAHPMVQEEAAAAVIQIDPENQAVFSALAELIGKRPQFFHETQIQGLTRRLQNKAVAGFAKVLKDKNPVRRVGAILALESMHQGAAGAADDLKEAMKDDQAVMRIRAARALWRIQGSGETVAPVLLEALKDKDAGIRYQALDALQGLGDHARSGVPTLIEILKSNEEGLHLAASQVLKSIGPAAKKAVPALIEVTKNRYDGTRAEAANALGAIGPEAKDAVPQLLNLLKDPSAKVRGAAAQALGLVGPQEKEVRQALIQAIADKDPVVRTGAGMGLRQIGQEMAGEMAKLLKDKDPQVRSQAAEILAGYGPAAKEALPALLAALEDKDRKLAVSAAAAVWSIKHEAAKVLPALIRGLVAEEVSIRQQAARILGQMGAEAKPAIPALLAASKDRDPTLRQLALTALQQIDPPLR